MKREAVLLLVAVAVAGCTASPGGSSEGPTVQGVTIEQAQWESPRIAEGQSTDLIVRAANTNPTMIGNFQASLLNTAGINKFTLKTGVSSCSSPPCSCGPVHLDAATPDAQPRKVCVWGVTAPTIGRAPQKTFPVTLLVNYTANLTARDASAKITVSGSDSNLASRAQKRYSNGEIQATIDYRPTIRKGGSMMMTITVRDIGNGRIPSQNGARKVTVKPAGTLFNDYGFVTNGPCGGGNFDIVFFSEDEPASIECVLAPRGDVSVTEGTTYTMRLPITYTYQRTRELPLTVLSVD